MQADGQRAQRARGTGRLVTKTLAGRTRLDRFYQEGCAKIRLPQSFDAAMEAVLINTAGGLTGGDHLDWHFDAAAGTRLVLTTQACERVYKAMAGTATVEVVIRVASGARADWLPQETILFDRASMTRRLSVELAEDAEFLAVEAVLLGRKAMGEAMETGLFRDSWRVRREGRLVHAEEARLSGDVAALSARRAVLDGNCAFATILFCSPRAEAMIAPLRREFGDRIAGLSVWQDKLVARLVAADGFSLRKMLIPVISHLRNGGAVPKVWTL
ncbi:urease accessory protein UreD [Rhizobium sp. TRM95111]|uniref:urease accessory protein UreD n=1 Tax=Rhizobium alarense TaxID=2846851 RepID=UPI001F235C00|nr:urease accessory protein UreD [Rhizobium alarense]MCF3640919.1 urease accessory protein UreD [Rhizobium alarense]